MNPLYLIFTVFGGFSLDKKAIRQKLPFLAAVCIFIFLIVATRPPADGWNAGIRGVTYVLDGKSVTGWQEIGDARYYFGDNGILRTGWQQIDGEVYYLGTDGVMVTDWLQQDGKLYYLRNDGSLASGQQEIDGELYQFTVNGEFVTGMVETEGQIRIYNDHGFLHQGWIELNGARYYADENGIPLCGWQEIGGTRYYFHNSGAAASGWIEMNGFAYYFYTDGAAAQGKLTIDGKTHYFASNGQHLYLVNPWNPLPEDYTTELVSINSQYQIAATAFEDFMDMMTDCRAAGLEPMVCSAYRTMEYQEELYQNRIDRYVKSGYSEAEATRLAGYSVAVPGTSEHQLGLAVDIVDNDNWHLNETQANMPTQKWLMENSWRYGWILRYPNEKSQITGIIYEPWHYRYVGRPVAKEIYESGLCLEEYLEMLTNAVG